MEWWAPIDCHYNSNVWSATRIHVIIITSLFQEGKPNQGSTLTVARLPGATDFRWGQVKNYRQWAIALICTILNLSDCHNRQRMSVAGRAINLGGKYPKKFLALRAKRSNQLVSIPANEHSPLKTIYIQNTWNEYKHDKQEKIIYSIQTNMMNEVQ